MEKDSLFIGVMSGTSLDGIDIAICRITENGIQTLHAKEYSYDSSIKEDILNAISNPITFDLLGRLNHKLGLMYSNAINQFLVEFKIDSKDVQAIGLHGQTIWHSPTQPFPFSMQIGDGSLVSKKTGIDVVNDFRSGDIANGGEGAPLTPAFHKALFNDNESAVLNLGGIANITILSNGFIGYDVGVANILSDYWIGKHKDKFYDKDGEWAKQGRVNNELLSTMLSDSYFEQEPPKSTGREYFNGSWLENTLKKFSNISPVDVQATLLEFIIVPVVKSLQNKKVKRLIVCGGGAHNSYLMDRLSQKLNKIDVLKSDELGIDSTFLEAIAFAWLAFKRVNNEAIDLQTITGASKQSILGAIHAKD